MEVIAQKSYASALANSIRAALAGPNWTPWHWAITLAPCALIAVNSFFSTAFLAEQEGFRFLPAAEFFLRLVGFCAWAVAIRGGWAISQFVAQADFSKRAHVWMAHGLFSFFASIVIILLISPLFFAMQYPATWLDGLPAKVAYVWLEHVGLLLLGYFMAMGLFSALRQGQREAAQKPHPQPHRLEVAVDGVRRIVEQEKIVWIEAMGNYVTLHLDGESILMRSSLNDVESKLNPQTFYRSHRSAIVNVASVCSYERKKNGLYAISLSGGAAAPLSRQKLSTFRARTSIS